MQTMRNPFSKLRRTTATLSGLAVILAACGGATAPNGDASETQELTEWTHMLSSGIDVGPAYIWAAEGLGYFEDEGIDLVVSPSEGETQSLQLLATGEAESATPNAVGMLSAASRGDEIPVTSVYNLVPRLHYWPATLADSEIEAVSDLAGHKVGVFSLASATTNYIQEYAREVGLDPESDLELLPVGQGIQAAEALTSGQVDALSLWDVTYQTMIENGYDLKFLPQSELGQELFGNMVVVGDEVLAEQPELVEGFLRAVTKSLLIASENPRLAACFHYNMFPETRPTGKSAEELLDEGAAVIEARVPQLQPREGMTFGEFSEAGWEAWAEFLHLEGEFESYSEFFTNELVEAVNNFDYDEVREAAREAECDLS